MSYVLPSSALVVDVSRGPAIESRHFVHAVLMNGAGAIIAAHGDPKRLTFPRSTLKPLQALPLLESGAAEFFHLTDAEIALACASHSGEEKHVGAVAAWLKRIGLDDAALECGAHAPYSDSCHPASILCNNCSGKHTGMLTLALFMKAPVHGYTDPHHPVQQAILKKISTLCGTNLTPAICGVDGCSAPNPAMPLENLARGFAALMKQEDATSRRIVNAMMQHADLVGGIGRLDTALMQAAKGEILSKTGAEGVYMAMVPAKDTVIVLKAEDGASRAAQAALVGLLEKYKLASNDVLDVIRPLAQPLLKNWRGIETGRISC